MKKKDREEIREQIRMQIKKDVKQIMFWIGMILFMYLILLFIIFGLDNYLADIGKMMSEIKYDPFDANKFLYDLIVVLIKSTWLIWSSMFFLMIGVGYNND